MVWFLAPVPVFVLGLDFSNWSYARREGGRRRSVIDRQLHFYCEEGKRKVLFKKREGKTKEKELAKLRIDNHGPLIVQHTG